MPDGCPIWRIWGTEGSGLQAQQLIVDDDEEGQGEQHLLKAPLRDAFDQHRCQEDVAYDGPKAHASQEAQPAQQERRRSRQKQKTPKYVSSPHISLPLSRIIPIVSPSSTQLPGFQPLRHRLEISPGHHGFLFRPRELHDAGGRQVPGDGIDEVQIYDGGLRHPHEAPRQQLLQLVELVAAEEDPVRRVGPQLPALRLEEINLLHGDIEFRLSVFQGKASFRAALLRYVVLERYDGIAQSGAPDDHFLLRHPLKDFNFYLHVFSFTAAVQFWPCFFP